MRIERTKNAARNLNWGIVNKIIGLFVPFICRGAIIRIFGMNYLGLNSLFASILTALNFAELGFGSAIVYFMYQAIAEDDNEKICALMQYYKYVYRIIGITILLVGIGIMPLLPLLVKKDIPKDINLFIVYCITLSGTVVTYFLYAYKNSVLIAFQRNDIISKISTVILLCERVFQLFFIIVVQNYYFYLAVTVVMNVANNIAISRRVDKMYPQYGARGTLSKDKRNQIGEKIKGLFLYKVGGVVLSSADSIVISAFLGLVTAGIYGNYYYVISTLFSFLAIYYSSLRAGIGNSIAVETKKKNFNDFRLLQFMQNWIIGWCTVCLLCLLQDFIILYAGKENVLNNKLMIALCCYFFFWKIQDVVTVYKEAGGFWDADKYRPLIGAVINLGTNCILVQFIGLYGIVLSTIFVVVFIDIPWASKDLFHEYFDKDRREYFSLLIRAIIETISMALPTMFLCSYINTGKIILDLIIKVAICIVLPNIIFVGINFRKPEFLITIRKVISIVRCLV